MKHTRQLLLPAALLCALFSCTSHKLDREEAEEIITKHYDFPNVDFMRVSYGFGRHRSYMGQIYEISESSDVFEKTGRYLFEIRTGLTPLGQEYRAPEKACEVYFGNVPRQLGAGNCFCVAENIWELKEVSGIAVNETGETATVEYIVKATGVNTFGQYKDKSEGMLQTRKVTMKRYDDGSWRIEDEKPKYVVKPSDIAHYANTTR